MGRDFSVRLKLEVLELAVWDGPSVQGRGGLPMVGESELCGLLGVLAEFWGWWVRVGVARPFVVGVAVAEGVLLCLCSKESRGLGVRGRERPRARVVWGWQG